MIEIDGNLKSSNYALQNCLTTKSSSLDGLKPELNYFHSVKIIIISLHVAAIYLGHIKTSAATDLEQVRQMVNRMLEEKNADSETASRLCSDWCFVDCKCNSYILSTLNIYLFIQFV